MGLTLGGFNDPRLNKSVAAKKIDNQKELANVDGTKAEETKKTVKAGDLNPAILKDANTAIANYNMAGIKLASNGVENKGKPVVRRMDEKDTGSTTSGRDPETTIEYDITLKDNGEMVLEFKDANGTDRSVKWGGVENMEDAHGIAKEYIETFF